MKVQHLIDAGLSLVRIKSGTKHPAEQWKLRSGPDAAKYKTTAEFGHGYDVAVAAGIASQGVEILDFDTDENGDTVFDEFFQQVVDDLSDVVIQKTPSGGRHLIYRCDTVDGNKKLCRNGSKTLIETRGEGGYFLIEPSPGYEIILGDLRNLPLINTKTRQKLMRVARSLGSESEYFDEPKTEKKPKNFRNLFNKNRSIDWVVSVLEGAGWRRSGGTAGRALVTRDGKNKGTSGSIKVIDGVPIFYVFTTNSQFEADRGYSPFDLCQAVAPHLINQFGGEVSDAKAATIEDALYFFWGIKVDRVGKIRQSEEEAKLKFEKAGYDPLIVSLDEVRSWTPLENRFLLEWDAVPNTLSKDEKSQAWDALKNAIPKLPIEEPEEEETISYPLRKALEYAIKVKGYETDLDTETNNGLWYTGDAFYISFDDFVKSAFQDEPRRTNKQMTAALKQMGFVKKRTKNKRLWVLEKGD